MMQSGAFGPPSADQCVASNPELVRNSTYLGERLMWRRIFT